MKIVFISHSSNKYGAELSLLEMIDVLRKKHECVVFLPKKGDLSESLKKIGIKIVISKYNWWVYKKEDSIIRIAVRFLLNIVYSVFTAFKIKKNNPDIIFSNSVVINVGLVTSFLFKIPHVSIIHESMGPESDFSFIFKKNTSMNIINKYSKFIIVPSKILQNEYKKNIDINKIRLIYLQNIKKPKIKNQKKEKHNTYLKLIMVGSISKNKNQIMAIEAINKLKRSCVKEIKLYILGTGDTKYINALKLKILEYNLKKNIQFLGYIKNPYEYILKSDCLLVLSNFESFGRTIIEGMMCEKLIIAQNNSGGASEIIKNGETGFLYQKGSVEDLCSKIIYIHKNKEKCIEIIKKAKKFSNNFSQPNKYQNELNELIKNTIINKKYHA